ncbi:hypothetical protein, partial [Arcobacter cloacae]
KEFTISEVAEESSGTTIQGNFQTQSSAQKGSGIAALETSRDALAKLITGKQQDVYTASQLFATAGPKDFTYAITIYDKEIGGAPIPVPNDGGNPLNAVPMVIDDASSIDDFVTQINSNADLSKYIEARNVNGNLVISTLDSNFDVEFTGSLKESDDNSGTAAGIVGNLTPIDVNANYSGRKGAGAEFIEIVNKVDQTASKGSLQLRLDTL